jgi:GNAT superfamily N-acetyltransferase
MPQAFSIRQATVADVDVITRHRAAMFEEMGILTRAYVDPLEALTRVHLQQAILAGEYVGWLATPSSEPSRVVAGAGVQIRRVLPFPVETAQGCDGVAAGREAIVLNVYTEPEFRRQGAARTLMLQVVDWARDTGIERLVLQAAPDGRALYEALGFVATSEMRFSGDLRRSTRSSGNRP